MQVDCGKWEGHLWENGESLGVPIQSARRRVRSTFFGFVRERWEYRHLPSGKISRDQWAALLNGESLPDQYQEGYEAGKKYGAVSTEQNMINTAPTWCSTEALEAELKRRREPITSGYSVPVNTTNSVGNSTITFTYFDTAELERRKADRRKPDITEVKKRYRQSEAKRKKPKKRKTRP